jgi:hypothetical protein
MTKTTIISPQLWIRSLIFSYLVLSCLVSLTKGFHIIQKYGATYNSSKRLFMSSSNHDKNNDGYDGARKILGASSFPTTSSRRSILLNSASLFPMFMCWLQQPSPLAAAPDSKSDPVASTAEARKFIQSYPDFTQVIEDDGSFWSYKDVKVPSTDIGASPQLGDRVVYEWSGYTIGYFGRPFEAKGGPQGGAFDKELDYSRSVLGKGELVKGLERAFLTDNMKVGTIRQVVIPYGSLSYPPGEDADHSKVGPKPSTFSGQRALNFVLDNPRVDRTLLFNIKLVRIDTPDKQGTFRKK